MRARAICSHDVSSFPSVIGVVTRPPQSNLAAGSCSKRLTRLHLAAPLLAPALAPAPPRAAPLSPPSAFPVLPHTPVFQAIITALGFSRADSASICTSAYRSARCARPPPPVTPTNITHRTSAQHNKTPRQPTPGPPSSSRQLLSSRPPALPESLPSAPAFPDVFISHFQPLDIIIATASVFSTHRQPPCRYRCRRGCRTVARRFSLPAYRATT